MSQDIRVQNHRFLLTDLNLNVSPRILQTGFPCVALGVLKLTVDHSGLQLRDPLASASRLLELKACATTLSSESCKWSNNSM